MMIFFLLFLPLSYCFFFLDSFLFLRSHLVLDLRFFFIKSFIFLLFVFFFSKTKKKKHAMMPNKKKRVFSRKKAQEEEALLWLLTERVYDDDFSSQNIYIYTERKQAKWKIYFSHKAKNKKKKIKNCLVNISSSYPSSEIGKFFFFRMWCRSTREKGIFRSGIGFRVGQKNGADF